jgi:DNA-damage-inducible protein D
MMQGLSQVKSLQFFKMSEDLPTSEKSVKQIEKEQMARLKAKAKRGKLMLDE